MLHMAVRRAAPAKHPLTMVVGAAATRGLKTAALIRDEDGDDGKSNVRIRPPTHQSGLASLVCVHVLAFCHPCCWCCYPMMQCHRAHTHAHIRDISTTCGDGVLWCCAWDAAGSGGVCWWRCFLLLVLLAGGAAVGQKSGLHTMRTHAPRRRGVCVIQNIISSSHSPPQCTPTCTHTLTDNSNPLPPLILLLLPC
jgi:hypothetical protein